MDHAMHADLSIEMPALGRGTRPREADVALVAGAFLLGAIAARVLPVLLALLAS